MDKLATAVTQATNSIAPSWPLDSAVAINPHWHRIQQPIAQVANRLAHLGGVQVLPARSYLQQQWQSGRITADDLAQALEHNQRLKQQPFSLVDCLNLLRQPQPKVMPLVVDLMDAALPSSARLPWRGAITFQLSQTCAAYFDQQQAHWQPQRTAGLYAFWLDTLKHDRGTATVMRLPNIQAAIAQLPDTASNLFAWAQAELNFPTAQLEEYFEALLLSINGWASWCAWLKFEAAKQSQQDEHLQELLAMRLAWEVLLLKCFQAEAGTVKAQLSQYWCQLPQRLADTANEFVLEEIWQHALEIGFQKQLFAKLAARSTEPASSSLPMTQLVFCIDIRSEPMRRALESLDTSLETCAFAGFFGLPMAYQPFGSKQSRAQLPGLAAASVKVVDQPIAGAWLTEPMRKQQLAAFDQWHATVRWANSTFSFVEAVGLGYLPRIWHWLKPQQSARKNPDYLGLSRAQSQQLRPRVVGLAVAEKVALAANALQVMGLSTGLAPLVVLVGHASHSTNNAHSSTLDCGACGGQSGEANVRAMAALLNEPEVRQGLQQQGIDIPEETQFMAALHITTTDEIIGFDLDLLPLAQQQHWQQLQPTLLQAGDAARRERATSLAMSDQGTHKAVLKRFRQRANDGAQTRPEWGLTTNAGFIIGPRSLTKHEQFKRCYLHDYDYQQDTDFSVLERLMTGPLLVTHWLNMQYHASATDPLHYGSGNKVLHNVVGGNIGVFEGNGGDLRIGLPKQSVFIGQQLQHEPLRQTTIIAAPKAAVAAIIAKHPVLQQLFDNGWMSLWLWEDGLVTQYFGSECRFICENSFISIFY